MAGVRTRDHDRKYGSEDVLQCLCAVFAVDADFHVHALSVTLQQCQRQYLAGVGVLHLLSDCLFSRS
jgi:hypothetical protein